MADKILNIDLDQETYDELKEFKDEAGLTWLGMLKFGTIFDDYPTDEEENIEEPHNVE